MPLISALQTIAAADASGVGTLDFTGLVYKPAALGAHRTLTVKDPMICSFDAGAAHRDLTLEAEAVCPGRVRFIINSGAANNLVVKNDAASTIVTIGQNQGAIVYCDGTAWSSLGLVAITV